MITGVHRIPLQWRNAESKAHLNFARDMLISPIWTWKEEFLMNIFIEYKSLNKIGINPDECTP